MKGNNGKGNIEERDVWQTPKELFNNLNKQYFFEFDCCANSDNTKCKNFSNDFESISTTIDTVMCWMNPPFTKAFDMFNHFTKIVKKGVAIYRCDNLETKVWQDVILPNASWVLIPKGRINYESISGGGSRFPSALIGFGVEPPKYVKGVILLIR